MEVNNNSNKDQQQSLKDEGPTQSSVMASKKEAWTEDHDELEVEQLEETELSMFDASLLSTLPSPQNISEKNPSLILRPLKSGDFGRGFIDLLRQLTSVGNVAEVDFKNQFNALRRCSGTYYNTVIIDKDLDRVIGAGTLIIERKFIHECSSRGIIEEIIVSDQYRGKRLGKLLTASLIELGKSLGCYKITLNCTDAMIPFYEGLGFKAEAGNANFLVIRVPKA